MPKLDKRTGRPVKMSKAELVAKFEADSRARRDAQEEAWALEPWTIPVPLIDHDPDLAESSATCADASAHFATFTKVDLPPAFRHITVAMISGEEMEMLVQPGETVRALAERVALIKQVFRVKLLLNHAALPEDRVVLECVPRTCVVTAVLQLGLDFPNRLDPIVEQQIRRSCELNDERCAANFNRYAMAARNIDPEAFWSAAFKKPTWSEFVHHIGTEDFQIRVFSFGLNPLKKKRFIDYNFGMGGNSFGSIHAENEVRATAICDDGAYLSKVDASERFLEELEAAARAKHGIQKFGQW